MIQFISLGFLVLFTSGLLIAAIVFVVRDIATDVVRSELSRIERERAERQRASLESDLKKARRA